MSLNDLKAEFSQAYVRAIAHAAGFFVQSADRMLDNDGVDLTIFRRGAKGVIHSLAKARLAAQVHREAPF